jgi:alkylation response protein AidB-like acyl-CoA dehydrogenase
LTQVVLGSGNETDERKELRSQLRRLLAKYWDDEHIRAYADGDTADGLKLMSVLQDDMALNALMAPEEYGGVGGGCVEMVIAMEELGAAMVPSRLLAATMASRLLVACRNRRLGEILRRALATGSPSAVLWPGDDATWDVRQISTAVVNERAVRGSFRFVPEIDHSSLLLCPATKGGQYGLAVLGAPVRDEGLKMRGLRSPDLFRPLRMVTVSLEDCEWVGLAEPTGIFAEMVAAGAVVLAAEMIGSARGCLERMGSYAQQRHQFGKPIGTFQALKHRIVDALVAWEAARAVTYRAAARFDAPTDGNREATECVRQARMAKAAASDALRMASKECIQVHGGIGFTWENPVHFYLKRWATSARLFGSANQLRLRVYQDAVGGGSQILQVPNGAR